MQNCRTKTDIKILIKQSLQIWVQSYGFTSFSSTALARDGEGQSQYDKIIHITQGTPVPIEGRGLPADVHVDCLSGYSCPVVRFNS